MTDRNILRHVIILKRSTIKRKKKTTKRLSALGVTKKGTPSKPVSNYSLKRKKVVIGRIDTLSQEGTLNHGAKRKKVMLADQHAETDYSSGGESDLEPKIKEVVNLALMATHNSAGSSSSVIKVRLIPDLNKYEYTNNSYDKCESTSESNTSLDKGLTYKIDTRLKIMLDESHAILLKKDGTIQNLRSEILELEFKVKELESTLLELNTSLPYVDEIEILRNALNKPQDENKSLTSTIRTKMVECENIHMNLELMNQKEIINVNLTLV